MTNFVEILLVVCALIVTAVVIIGFLLVRSRIRKKVLDNTRKND